MGASIEEHLTKKVTHMLAVSPKALLERVGSEKLANFKGVSNFSPFDFLRVFVINFQLGTFEKCNAV